MFNQKFKEMSTKKNNTAPEKKVISDKSAQAQKILQQAEANKESKEEETTAKPETKTTVKKEPKLRTESMEKLGERLRKEKATEDTIKKAFTSAYKVKGIVDKAFIEKRITIYMKIADKHLANAK